MSNDKTGSTASTSRALQPTTNNPLDFVPNQTPFDTPYGPPISLDRSQAVIHTAMTEAKKRNWEMNVAVSNSDSGGTSSPFNEWTARYSRPLRLRNTKLEQQRPSGAKRSNSRTVSSSCI